MNGINELLTPLNNGAVTQSNGVKKILEQLHDTYGLSFGDIRAIPEFSDIPRRTLHAIYAGHRDVPKKFRTRFHIPAPVPTEPCWCGEVHTKGHPKERKHKTLWSTPVKLLRWQLDNRSEVCPP